MGDSVNTEITDNIGNGPAGWVFYDQACPWCVRTRHCVGRLFAARGFVWLPLQTPGTARRLGVLESDLERRLHVMRADGRICHNADALGILCRSVWWLWPLGLLLLVPGIREGARMAYDWLARNRYCLGGRCRADFNARPLVEWLNNSLALLPLIYLWAAWAGGAR